MRETPDTRVTVVQHADKERTPGDPGLSRLGRAQAAHVAARLATERIDVLWSSPLRRARETAAPIAASSGQPVLEDERLSERMNWTGLLPIEDFLADWQRATADRTYAPRLGDSSQVAGARFADAVRSAARDHPGEHAVLVTHGGVTVDGLRTLVGDETLSDIFPGWAAGVPACGLTTLRVSDPGVRLLAVADTAHLP